jgi:hypothetical protein
VTFHGKTGGWVTIASAATFAGLVIYFLATFEGIE